MRRPRRDNDQLAWPDDVLLAVYEHVELPLCHVKRLIKSQVNVFAWPAGVGMDYDPLYITLVSLDENVLLYPFPSSTLQYLLVVQRFFLFGCR